MRRGSRATCAACPRASAARRAACACRCPATGGPPTGSATSPASSARAGPPRTWPFRRAALDDVGGFDERFPRAYREDADLGLRLAAAGWQIVRGQRRVRHPVGPADRWVSVRKQAGNADDALMRAPARAAAGASAPARPRGRLAATRGSPRRCRARWRSPRPAAGAARLAAAARAGVGWRHRRARRGARIAPGPRTAARDRDDARDQRRRSRRRAAALLAARPRRGAAGGRRPAAASRPCSSTATARSIHDVPYNGDPDRVAPDAGRARRRSTGCAPPACRSASSPTSRGIARGLLDAEPGRRGERPGRGAARPVRPLLLVPARARRRLRLPQARARAGAATRRAALGVDPRAARHRRHRRRRRGRPRGRGARRPRAHGRAPGARRSRPPPRSPPTSARRSTLLLGQGRA